MTKELKPDGWCGYLAPIGWLKYSMTATEAACKKEIEINEPDWTLVNISPVKIVPYDTWERLMAWCDECASNTEGGQWELRVKLNKILEEVENGTEEKKKSE